MEELEAKLQEIVKNNKSIELAYKEAYEYVFSLEFKTIEDRNLVMMAVRDLILESA